MSVTKLTEDGNVVKFTRKGGTISDPKSGRTVHFRRYKGVYVLEAEVDTGRKIENSTTAHRRAPCGSASAVEEGGIEAAKSTTFQRQGR